MVSKYDNINELLVNTTSQLTASPDTWMAFLRTSTNTFKYSFTDQVLIHAQRPSPTACAPLTVWNRKPGHWVNRGARGIALIVYSGAQPMLRHVFDIADTNNRGGRPFSLWEMQPSHAEAVIETLDSTFGTIEDKNTTAVALYLAVGNAVEDNYQDYAAELAKYVEGSFLEELASEELDSDALDAEFRMALEVSVAYTVFNHLGIAPELSPTDFAPVLQSNTLDTIVHLGTATSNISEMMLREIARTVEITAREQSSTFANFGPGTGEAGSSPVGFGTGPACGFAGMSCAASQIQQGTAQAVEALTAQMLKGGTGPGQGDAPDGMGAAHEQPEAEGRGAGDEGEDLSLGTWGVDRVGNKSRPNGPKQPLKFCIKTNALPTQKLEVRCVTW